MALSRASEIAAVPDSPIKGIAVLVFGLSLFSLQDVIIKLLSDRYPAHEIVFIRGLVALAILMVLHRGMTGSWRVRLRRPGLNALRGVMGLASYTFYYMALASLSLADAVTMFYSSPLFVTVLSVVFLDERVGRHRWMALAGGFLGVVVIMRPGSGDIEPAMLLALLSALCYAGQTLITRRLSRHESSTAMSLAAMLTFVVVSGAIGLAIGNGAYDTQSHASLQFLLRAWSLPTARDLALLIACGGIAGIGFYCLSLAYSIAPASLVSPFEYASLPWAVLWGFLFWASLPGPHTWLGVLLVVGSGLYMLRREALLGRRTVTGRSLRPRI